MTLNTKVAEITKLTLKADHQHIPFTDSDIVEKIRDVMGFFTGDFENDFNQRFPQETNAPIPQQQYQPNHLTQQHDYEVYQPQHVQNNWGNQVNVANPFNNQYPQQNYPWPQNHPLSDYNVINQPNYQGQQFYQHQQPYIPAAGYQQPIY